ncbi:MAG: metal ABC transporter substrate-binding protein, partial [Cyanobacteria bacterium P01_H01_bin.15]
IFLFAIAVSHLPGCNAPSTNADIEKAQEVRPEDAREKPIIFTTNYPLTYFAERITDGAVTINYLVPPNIDSSLWRPKPTDVAQMQTGDLIFINGVTYEKWLDFVSLPESKLIDTSVVFQEQYLEIENSQTHRHGPEGEHTHTGTVAITWLNLQFAIAQADTIRAALMRLRPDLAATFQENFLSLKQDLEDLDKELETALGPYINQPLLAPYPMYEYLAQRYNLNLKSVSWE